MANIKPKKGTKRKPELTLQPPINGHTFAYKVDKGIQLTTIRTKYLADKFPFSVMNIGDSFLVPATDPVAKNPNTVHYAAHQYAKMKPGFTVTTRVQLNKDRRVWRIK